MILTFIQDQWITRKLELVQSVSCKRACNSQNVCYGLLRKGGNCKEVAYYGETELLNIYCIHLFTSFPVHKKKGGGGGDVRGEGKGGGRGW